MVNGKIRRKSGESVSNAEIKIAYITTNNCNSAENLTALEGNITTKSDTNGNYKLELKANVRANVTGENFILYVNSDFGGTKFFMFGTINNDTFTSVSNVETPL